MKSIVNILRYLYRKRMWLLLLPLLVAVIVYFRLGHKRIYEAETTIYTGVVSGYDLEYSGTNDWNATNNAMDNIINIITAQTTLKCVSMRLYAQNMMYGDPDNDNNYITAANYRALYAHAPEEIRNLIDKTSEERTLENLYAYEEASHDNYVYGLFNWHHRHYSYQALKEIKVRRIASSDMLQISYANDDPGITYNTLAILNEEFIKQYEDLRFGETNNVIAYFEEQLRIIGTELRTQEAELTDYNVTHKVINYEEQTKYIAALGRDNEIRYQDILLAYESSERLLGQMDERIEQHVLNLRNNTVFISKLDAISNLTMRISTIESFQLDSMDNRSREVDILRKDLARAEEDMKSFVAAMGTDQYSKEGISSSSFVDEWVTQLIVNEKAKAELRVIKDRMRWLDSQYVVYSPIGSTLKRWEREIGFTEQNYLSILNALNSARLRQKNLQMTSATLKVINPPIFPLDATPSKRRLIVMAAFFATIIFLLGAFILIELLDRTLRDKDRAERLTGAPVIAAFPAQGSFRGRDYEGEVEDIAVQTLINTILPYLGQDKPHIINILNLSPEEDTSYMVTKVVEHLRASNIDARCLSWETDFDTQSKEYLFAGTLRDIYNPEGEEVVLVEHPLGESSVPNGLLRSACINIVAVRADKAWSDTDQILLDNLRNQLKELPMGLLLTASNNYALQNFTGMLPPYTYFKKFGYKLYQFGLTARIK